MHRSTESVYAESMIFGDSVTRANYGECVAALFDEGPRVGVISYKERGWIRH